MMLLRNDDINVFIYLVIYSYSPSKPIMSETSIDNSIAGTEYYLQSLPLYAH